MVLQELRVTDQHGMSFNDARHTAPGDGLKALCKRYAKVMFRRIANHSLPQRMFAGAFECSRKAKKFIARNAAVWVEQDVRDLRPTCSDGACLIEDHCIDLFETLQRFAAFDQ